MKGGTGPHRLGDEHVDILLLLLCEEVGACHVGACQARHGHEERARTLIAARRRVATGSSIHGRGRRGEAIMAV